MKDIYEKVDGFFGWPRLYYDIVRKLPDRSTVIEVGSYKGKSLIYLLWNIQTNNKKFHVFSVDNFVGVEGYMGGNRLRDTFHDATEQVRDQFTLIEKLSWEAADDFFDGSVDFVFIDAAHDYDSVMLDIQSWLPKVKTGGIIAGHDYYEGFKGVVKAVDQIFGERVDKSYIDELCWLVRL